MTKKTPVKDITGLSERVFLLFALSFFMTIKVLFFIYANPLPDEAYYWLWSKNIALSYFDHPPFSAWVQALVGYLFDDKYYVIRLLPLVSLATLLSIMIVWQQRMFRKIDFDIYLKYVILFLAFPIFSIFFSISFPDHLLITLLCLSSFCLFLYFERNNGSNGIHYWYLASLFFSFALLTKYNSILLGAGVLTYILYYKKHLNGPSYGHIIVSVFIIFLIQTPVVLWNFTNDFASFSFHLKERLDDGKDLTRVLKNLLGFFSGVLLAFSPIFIFNLKDSSIFDSYSNGKTNFIKMGRFVFVFSITICTVLSYFTNVLYYWLTPAIVLLIPFLNQIIKSKMWQYIHIFYGMLISLVLFLNISIFPIGTFFGKTDRETAILFGWDTIIETVRKEKKERGIEEVIFSDYRLGSLYIFHSGDYDADVVMEKRKTQFDVWRSKDKKFATKTLILTDNNFPIGQKISSSFESIELIQDIDIYANNEFIKKYQVFLGTRID